jgi:prepilin-type N-terminal cleavage/methylation domain-containing protein
MAIPRNRTFVSGFSLVEIAVGLVIMGILLTMGLGVINAQLVSFNCKETRKRHEQTKRRKRTRSVAHKRTTMTWLYDAVPVTMLWATH